MKKTIKTLTAFLFLFALLIGIKPLQLPGNTNVESGISLCSDDDASEDAIRAE